MQFDLTREEELFIKAVDFFVSLYLFGISFHTQKRIQQCAGTIALNVTFIKRFINVMDLTD